jgi:hypothetical protein
MLVLKLYKIDCHEMLVTFHGGHNFRTPNAGALEVFYESILSCIRI